MYSWYVSFITEEGVKAKKVKANSKYEAIQKASKALDCRRLKECKWGCQYYY